MTRVLVFGRERGSGNAATVVTSADERDLASIAAENATPATAFLFSGSPRRVRFFTPSAELPMCGHGSLAAGAVEARRLGVPRVTLAAPGGDVVVDCSNGDCATLVLRAPGSAVEERDPAPLFAALGIAAKDVVLPLHVASAGSPKWIVEFRELRVLRELRPDMTALSELSKVRGVNGVYAVTRDGVANGADAFARAFNPLAGVDEDAATGIAAAALAWLWRDRFAGSWLVIDQGIRLRDLNRLRAQVAGGEIRVGGSVEIVEESE